MSEQTSNLVGSPTGNRHLTLTVDQIKTLSDALFGSPPDRDTANSVQSVLWAATWAEDPDHTHTPVIDPGGWHCATCGQQYQTVKP